jgi:rhodanese-related sulfurtransferase
MKNTFQKISIAFLLLLVVSACQSQQSEHVKVVSKEVFADAIKNEVQLVDVRTADEYKRGFIGQAQNVDVNSNSFEQEISKLDKNKPVYIYCHSGSRSQKAARKMTELGFKEIIDLEGGYMNW